MRETRETVLLHVACGNPARQRYCMGEKFSCIRAHRMHIHIFNKVAVRKNYECQKYEKILIHENADAILVTVTSAVLGVDFHTHTDNHIARSIIVRYSNVTNMTLYTERCAVQPKKGILRRTSPIFRPVTFLVAFGLVLAALA